MQKQGQQKLCYLFELTYSDKWTARYLNGPLSCIHLSLWTNLIILFLELLVLRVAVAGIVEENESLSLFTL